MSPEKLERFSAGERFAVDPDAIERELSSLWRAAGDSTELRHPVTRACLWNVVVHIEARPRAEGTGMAEAMTQVVRDLPQYLAARALVLRTEPPGEGPELESWISANCIIAGGGGKLVCSEEVAISARGDGERHLPALVRALLVPAVPTAVFFAGVPSADDPLVESLLRVAERVVVHADRSLSPAPLKRLSPLFEAVPLGAMDLGWLKLSPIRSLLASLFDPPATEEDARAVERVHVVASAARRWSALLLLAWVVGVLGGDAPKRIGDRAWRFSRPGGKPLEAVLAEETGRLLPAIELSGAASGCKWAVRPQGEGLAEILGRGISSRKPVGLVRPAALLARALATRSEDQALKHALALARSL